MARVREAGRGERIVEQWSTSREFYVVLDGAVDVLIDDEHINTLAAGDFFGEFAALDWAAGFAYPRLASVVAREPLRLLVFPDGALNELVRDFPSVEKVIHETLHERRLLR
jgi:CRP-like cAMP-binding protein